MSAYLSVLGLVLASAIALLGAAVAYVRTLLWCGDLRRVWRVAFGVVAYLAFSAAMVAALFVLFLPLRLSPTVSPPYWIWLLAGWIASCIPALLYIKRHAPALQAAGFFLRRRRR